MVPVLVSIVPILFVVIIVVVGSCVDGDRYRDPRLLFLSSIDLVLWSVIQENNNYLDDKGHRDENKDDQDGPSKCIEHGVGIILADEIPVMACGFEFEVHASDGTHQDKGNDQIHRIRGQPRNGGDENHQHGNTSDDDLDERGFVSPNKDDVRDEHHFDHNPGRVKGQRSLPN